MKIHASFSVVLSAMGALALLVPLPEAAQAADAEKRASTSSKPLQFSYKGPLRGAPATRVGGGTRAAGTDITLNVLAPNETGYTVEEKPSVYWYVSETIESPVEITIVKVGSLEEAVVPLLELTLQPPIDPGFHALGLETHGVSLELDAEYQWFVAVVRDPEHRSKDILAGGTIKRVSPSKTVEERLNQSAQSTWPEIYAEAGIWYDALDWLSKQIVLNPTDRDLREQRAGLLEQVGLPEAAAYDRGGGS